MTLLAPGLWLQRLTTREPSARPARGLDPGAPRGARSRGPARAGRPTGGGDGVVATVRRAEFEWIGGLKDGEGKIVSTTTGALPELEVTWNGPGDEDQEQITSPEELLAAATPRASRCSSRPASSAPAGSRRRCTVTARSRSRSASGSPARRSRVRVTVDGLTDEQIRDIARSAKVMRPLSRALTGIDVTLELPELAPPRGRGRGRSSRRSEASARPDAASAARLGPAMAGFEDLIDELERSYAELQERMSDPRSTTTTARRRRSAGA